MINILRENNSRSIRYRFLAAASRDETNLVSRVSPAREVNVMISRFSVNAINFQSPFYYRIRKDTLQLPKHGKYLSRYS